MSQSSIRVPDVPWHRERSQACPNCGEQKQDGSSAPLHPCHDCPDDFHGPKCPSCGFRRATDYCRDPFHKGARVDASS